MATLDQGTPSEDKHGLTQGITEALCQELAAMLALSPDGLVAFGRQGQVSQVTAAFESLTRLPARQLQGLDEDQFWQLLSSQCAPQTASGQWSVFRHKLGHASDARPGLLVLTQPPGVVLQVTQRYSDTGLVAKLLCFRDVTPVAERERRKSGFLSTAGHELRNPLANIQGFAEVLLNPDNDAASRREFTEIIYQQSQVMTQLLNDVLTLAHTEARGHTDLVLSFVALPQLVQSVLDVLGLPEGRARASLALSEEDLSVWVDAKKASQAVSQVLANAYKFSPAGGVVQIQMERVTLAHSIPEVAIHITDHGLGMTPEQLSHLGERFYRAQPSASIPGNGLGMSLVKEIMDLLDGRLEVQSTPGQGTRVSLYWPAV
jgi:signal transduction histidine kinase